MRFGISTVAAGIPQGATQRSIVAERIEMVRVARDAGFEVVSAGQHFCATDLILPQPIPLLARLAPEGPGMTFQTGVMLGPFYHPVVLAEEIATLAAITGDRFRAALGLGYRDNEFVMFGQDRTERVRRVIELTTTTRRLLRGETVTTPGGFYPMSNVALTPGAVSRSPIPILLGTGTANGARRAGRIADGILITGYLPMSDVGDLTRSCATSAAARGVSPVIGICREVSLAASRKTALQRSAAGLIHTLTAYLGHGYEHGNLARVVRDLAADGDSPDLPFIVGSPQECAEQISRYGAVGVQELIIRFGVHDASHHETLKAIERFGAEVIPLINQC